jgi:hypothetical protein
MSSRRSFLASAGAALLAAPTLSEATGNREAQYVVGLVANPTLGGPDGDLVLKVWASFAADGTGFGLLADRLDPRLNSHLKVRGRSRHGNRYRWEGEVIRSNEPTLVSQRFVLSAIVHGDAASPLKLALMGRTFSGKGLVTTS